MLSALSVRDIVLIERLDLVFDGGMTVLTGETGAGKSILLDALALALGGRGDQALVRAGCDSGQVIAELYLHENHPARALLRDNAIADAGQLVLRRVQLGDGRTRAFVNDQPVSAGLMRAVGGLAVEIHGQHADRALVDGATHRALLDAFGGLGQVAADVADAHEKFGNASRAAEAQRAIVQRAAREEEFARHVVAELTELAAETGEEDRLAARRQDLMALEKATGEVRDADEILNGSHAPGPALAALMRQLMRKSAGNSTLFGPVVEALDGALVALDATGEALDALKRDMAFDPQELERAEERLFGLRAAARKHGVSCDGLADVLGRYTGELAALESGEEALRALDAAETEARIIYFDAADRLSQGRSKAAGTLSVAVEGELPDLKLGMARFIVEQQADRDRVSAHGFDQIGFGVQTNPGTAPGPLMKVASGGELARFLLALKVVLADRGSAPVLVFDEIDAGVGGAVADAMGRRLGQLASGVQVLAVTHAPQVAARAGHHMVIEKETIAGGAEVRTLVRLLDDAGRREEVARMLAGANVTGEARAAAGRLIAEAAPPQPRSSSQGEGGLDDDG